MIKPEQVPYDAVEAARRAYETDYGHELSAFTSAIAAALNAWPNGYTTENREAWSAELILPLPSNDSSQQETRDDE